MSLLRTHKNTCRFTSTIENHNSKHTNGYHCCWIFERKWSSRERGPGKLCSFWKPNIYIIKERQDDNGLVYAVAKESNLKGKLHILHRNNLLAHNEFPGFGNYNERNRPKNNHNKHQNYTQQHQESEELVLVKENSSESKNEIIYKIQETGLRGDKKLHRTFEYQRKNWTEDKTRPQKPK